jgi:uncharacterized protein YciI
MKYAVLFEDNDEFAHKRPQFMADHLQFLADNSDKIDAAGPLKDAATQDPAGGLWLVEADDAGQVQALVEADPFWPTGLRKSIQILEWTRVYADGQKMI